MTNKDWFKTLIEAAKKSDIMELNQTDFDECLDWIKGRIGVNYVKTPGVEAFRFFTEPSPSMKQFTVSKQMNTILIGDK